MRTLVTASWVIAHDGISHVEIADGAVLIDGDTIVDVGARTELARHQADEHIDLGDAVITPGLVDLDALTDIDHLILDSWASPDLARASPGRRTTSPRPGRCSTRRNGARCASTR